MDDIDYGSLLSTGLQTGLGFLKKNEKPKPAAAAPAPAPTYTPPPKDNSGVMKWVLIGVGALAVVVTLGMFLKRGK